MNDWLPRMQADPPKREKVAEISDRWEGRLIKDKGGNRAPVLANFLIALRHAPEWAGVLGHDESAHRTIARKAPPWGGSRQPPYPWAEEDDIRAAEWAQLLGIMISPLTAAQGV